VLNLGLEIRLSTKIPARAFFDVYASSVRLKFCKAMGTQTVFQDFDRSSGERELVDMIKALHGEGLHVMLKLGGQPGQRRCANECEE